MRLPLLLLSSTLIWAADVTGTWSGPIEMTRDGETRSSNALLILKQDGAKITGTIGPNADDRTEVAKGTIDGSDVTLEAMVADQELKVTIRLKVVGDKLAGEFKVKGPNGPHMAGKMNLERSK